MPRLIVHGFTNSLEAVVIGMACASAVLFTGCADAKKELDRAAELIRHLSEQYNVIHCTAYTWHTWTGDDQFLFVGATWSGHQVVAGEDMRQIYADNIAEEVFEFYDSTFMKDYDKVLIYLASPMDTLANSPPDTLKRSYEVRDLLQLIRMRVPVIEFYEALRTRQFDGIRSTLSEREFSASVKDKWVSIYSEADTAFGHIGGLTHLALNCTSRTVSPLSHFLRRCGRTLRLTCTTNSRLIRGQV
ncbi:MAG: hypothetical protein R2811_05900 [Flavobacteriales bacterium]